MGYGPPQVVEGQPRAALPFGLLSVLTPRPASDERWVNGIEWETMTCAPASGFEDPSCDTFGSGEGQVTKFFQGAGDTGSATAFGVYGSHKCGSPSSSRAFEESQEFATAHLLAREQGQVEAHVWDRLAADATDLNGAGALVPQEALAALEDWMGRAYGSQGVIHMTRGFATVLGEGHLYRSGSGLYTTVGTPVSAGGGYPGTSPAGVAAASGEAWAFASPALFGYRGEVMTRKAFDQTRNDLYALAERPWVVGFDPCGVGAVRVNLA